MSETNSESLQKEFELERVILFSDAVFAIAITLLIIEIKFPELPQNYKISLDLFAMFRPTLGQFIGFLISFWFIGISWARHLNTFRYLRGYDNGLIGYNLFSLLFIVALPFFASGITHFRPSFVFPMVLYVGNLMFIALSNFLLVRYIFKTKPHLSVPGNDKIKNYIYMQAKITAIGLSSAFAVILATTIITRNNNLYMNLSLYAMVLAAIFMRRAIKKYIPENYEQKFLLRGLLTGKKKNIHKTP